MMLPKYHHGYGARDIVAAIGGLFHDRSDECVALLSRHFRRKHVLLLDSGRSCLDLTLAHLAFPAGSLVAVPATVCAVVVETIRSNGLVPVFIDVQDDLTLDLADLASVARREPLLRAVVAVAAYGNPYDASRLATLARSRHLVVIEDACQSWEVRDRTAIASFLSLDMAKYLSTIKGGILLTDDRALYDFAKAHARPQRLGFRALVELLGFMFLTIPWVYTSLTRRIAGNLKRQLYYAPGRQKLSRLQTGLLLRQLARLPEVREERMRALAVYQRLLPRRQILASNPSGNLHCPYLAMNAAEARRIEENGLVDLPRPTPLLSSLSEYRRFRRRCPNAERIAPRLVLLPLYGKLYKRLPDLCSRVAPRGS